jgi:hypothetical protein
MTKLNRRYHRGVGFDVWTDRGAWFWQLAGHFCGAGTIGSALSESEALREAHAVVEELSAQCARTRADHVGSVSHGNGSLAASDLEETKVGHDPGGC